MTLHTHIPPTANELALSARNATAKIQTYTMGRAATHDGLASMEAARKRALQALRDLGPVISTARRTLRAEELRERQDRAGAVMVVGVG